MTIKTMRAIERFAGLPLCWLAGAWNALAGRRRASLEKGIRTILVVKFFGMGSVLLSTPVLSLLFAEIPRARVLYLTFLSNRELLEKTGLPIEIVTISNTTFAAFVATAVRALRRLMGASVDVVFDLEFFSKFSTVVSVLCGARMRVGFDLPARWRRSNLTHPVALDRSCHVSRLFTHQLRAIGIRIDDKVGVAGLRASTEEKTSMEAKLGLAGNRSEIVCININAGTTSLERRWRPQRFVEVASRLVQEDPSRRIFFIGDASERGYVSQALVTSGADGFRNCSGELTFGELVALLERASFLVTNDSGPMHIATAAGIPVVALFGPESPAFYGPTGKSTICYKGIECSPCLSIFNAKQFVCPYDTRCMGMISTMEVLEAIQSLKSNVEAGSH